MGNPKSFKDLFKNKPQVPIHGGVPIAVQRPPQLTLEQQARIEKQKKELIQYVNTQRCTVCGSQLDGGVNEKDVKLYCVSNNDHYKCTYIPDEKLPVSCTATYTFLDYKVEYEVISTRLHHLGEGQYRNWVYKLDLNLIPKFRHAQKKLIMSYDGKLLKFTKGLTEQEFVQKLKIYTVFS